RGISSPLLEVVDESNGELVYTLRMSGATWQPHVFAPGSYTVKISEPESGKQKVLTGLAATPENQTRLQVNV
ncbi:MAG TPA: hypothetical protein VHC19_11980, partial [Pirellulales bacterium]|nr:hypothetical protein [Pirellulales bacterium]